MTLNQAVLPLPVLSSSEGVEAERPRMAARIEKVEFGDGFMVVTGWAVNLDGAVEIEVDGARHPVTALFERRDLIKSGLSSAPCAFAQDVPVPPGTPQGVVVRLMAQGRVLFSTANESTYRGIFKPSGHIDTLTLERATGWFFDPSVWHGAEPASRAELVLGDYRLPITADIRRQDLPFSSARSGRALGFTVELTQSLEAAHGDLALGMLGRRGTVDVALVCSNHQIVSSPLQFPPVPGFELRLEADLLSEEGEDGFIDYCGYSEGLGGLIMGGWIRNETKGSELTQGSLRLLGSGVSGNASFLSYDRPDVTAFGVGLLVFLPWDGSAQPSFKGMLIEGSPRRLLRVSTSFKALVEGEVVGAARQVLRTFPRAQGDRFIKDVSKPIYEGLDTLGRLSQTVLFEVDELILAGTDGAMLVGWMVDPNNAVRSVRVRSTGMASNPLSERWMATERPDIREAFGAQYGLTRGDFGFHAYASMPGLDPKRLYVEVTLHNGEVGFKPLPAPRLSGRQAMMRCLSGVHLTPDTVRHACANVIGPPVVAINRTIMAAQRAPAVLAAGPLPEKPRCSLLVPLYGRLDFMMYQMALMSEHDMSNVELVYVLDQPERKAEFLALARSCYQRYGLPARLVLPPDNLGFAGASNAALQASRGDYICFLNSDVMPVSGGWVQELVQTMEQDPGIGVLGAKLLFEDGTVQHRGMDMKRNSTFGNLPFPYHPGKGRMPHGGGEVRRVPLVTGALMMMRREVALDVGGFDTDYVIGDFEDAELCMQVRARGLDCAVHDGVRLYHLERQSQGSATNIWRQNLTLVNAQTFAQRWETAFNDLPVSEELMELE